MFQREAESGSKDAETIIGATVNVEGNFVSSGDIIVDGRVSGTLKTSKNLRVGESAAIKADIEAANIVVAGEVRGHVTCAGRVEVLATGKIFGNVDTQTISIAHGAILHGKVGMSGHEAGEAKSGK